MSGWGGEIVFFSRVISADFEYLKQVAFVFKGRGGVWPTFSVSYFHQL